MKPSSVSKWFVAMVLAASASFSVIAPMPVHAATPSKASALPPVGVTSVGVTSSCPPSPKTNNTTYAHTPVNSSNNLPPGNGNVMTNVTVYLIFWLGTGGLHFEPTGYCDDATYENLLIRFAQDVGGSQYHNLITQYYGNNGTITNTVTFGGSWVDTTQPYPHAGTNADPLQDADIQSEVKRAATINGWPERFDEDFFAVFTAYNIQECQAGDTECTFKGNPQPLCAYHDFALTPYAYMGDPCLLSSANYPNGDPYADSEVSFLSHELSEAETDPTPNATWSRPNPSSTQGAELGDDPCANNPAPQNDSGADVYLNGHPYMIQQEYSNAASTCAMDLPTNGFCTGSGSVSHVCAPSTSFSASVSNANPPPNQQVIYTFDIYNGNDTAAETNLTFTDNLPSGYFRVDDKEVPAARYCPSQLSTSVICKFDSLAVHQQQTITITVTVSSSGAQNCATLDGQDLIGTALSEQHVCPTVVPLGACPLNPNETNCNDQSPSAQGCNSYAQSFTYNTSPLYIQLYYSTNCQSNWTYAKTTASGYALVHLWIEREETLAYPDVSFIDNPTGNPSTSTMVWAPDSPARACASYKNLGTGDIFGAYCTPYGVALLTCPNNPTDTNCTGQDYRAQTCLAYAQSSPAPVSNSYVSVTDYYSTNCESNWAVATWTSTDPNWALIAVVIYRGGVTGGLGPTNQTSGNTRHDTTWWSQMVFAPHNPTEACARYMNLQTEAVYNLCTGMA